MCANDNLSITKDRLWPRLISGKLKEDFAEATYKHTEIVEVRTFIEGKLLQMLEQSHTRVDFA